MSKKIEFKVSYGYPEWIADEGWTNRGACDKEFPHQEMLQKPGQHGHVMTRWICVNTVSCLSFEHE